LTVKPVHAPLPEFVAGYRALVKRVYSAPRRLRKLADDLSHFLPRGYWFPALLDTIDTLAVDPVPDTGRSLVAGSDTPPPEAVPFGIPDFDSEHEYHRIMEPWRVIDASGAALPQWLTARPVFEREDRPAERKRARMGAAAV
jgi:hypothetical protein